MAVSVYWVQVLLCSQLLGNLRQVPSLSKPKVFLHNDGCLRYFVCFAKFWLSPSARLGSQWGELSLVSARQDSSWFLVALSVSTGGTTLKAGSKGIQPQVGSHSSVWVYLPNPHPWFSPRLTDTCVDGHMDVLTYCCADTYTCDVC